MSDAKSATLQPPVLCGTRWAVGVASRLLQHEIRLGLIETALFKHLFMRLASLIGLRRRRRRRQWTMDEVEEDKDDDDDDKDGNWKGH